MFITGSFTNYFRIGQNCFQIGNKSDTGCNEIFLIDFSWWQIMKNFFSENNSFDGIQLQKINLALLPKFDLSQNVTVTNSV